MYNIKTETIENKPITIIHIEQPEIDVTLMNYGATVLDIKTKNKDGIKESVVLGYKNIESYATGEMYLNAIIGPIAGRLKNASFQIDDSINFIDANFLETESLHSGKDCLAFKRFQYDIIEEETQIQVRFTYQMLESASHFPGNQQIQIIYTVKNSELKIEFIGDTTEPTILNLTSHLYFNLSGNIKRPVLDNILTIHASNTLLLDSKFVPYQVETLEKTHLDFRTPRTLQEVFTNDIYNRPERGIDNPYLFDEVDFNKPQITLQDPISKRELEVYTTYPSVVCYTHNHPDHHPLAQNRTHQKHLGICFETQNPPNGVNIPNVESSILRKNEEYYYKTVYKFTVKK